MKSNKEKQAKQKTGNRERGRKRGKERVGNTREIGKGEERERESERDSIKITTPHLNLLLRQRSNPKTPFNHPLNRLKAILGTRINQPKEVLNDSSRRAIPLKVNEWLPGLGRDLAWFLGVVGEVVDIEACIR